jgi:hypothetical protein
VSFAAITLCVASERVFIIVSVYFDIDSVQKLLDILSYVLSKIFFFFPNISTHATEFDDDNLFERTYVIGCSVQYKFVHSVRI